MGSVAIQRLESLLESRRLARGAPDLFAPDLSHLHASTGLDQLDAMLGGGWRRGAVSEIVGPRSSGRTSVLVASLTAAATRDEIVGLVDTVDRFDPVTAAAAGLDLDRLLWIRGPALTIESARAAPIEAAVRQAIRAFDLLVRAGGFGLVVLDVADVPPRYLRGLPFTTWMRLAHANEGRPTACVIVGESPVGRSARGVTVQLEASGCWTGQSAQSRRLAGLEIRCSVRRADRPVLDPDIRRADRIVIGHP